MPIGAGGILRATLLTGMMLAAGSVAAQTNAGGVWTDPPARNAAPVAPVPVPAAPTTAAPAAKVAEPSVSETKDNVAKVVENKPAMTEPATRRQAAVRNAKRHREVRRVRPRAVAETRPARTERVERRAADRSPRRVIARSFASRYVEARPYAYAPLPVGRVEEPSDGERNPIFADGDDRGRRIAAAQAAGYLVVRSRSVQFPDGRSLRTYRPYDGDDRD